MTFCFSLETVFNALWKLIYKNLAAFVKKATDNSSAKSEAVEKRNLGYFTS